MDIKHCLELTMMSLGLMVCVRLCLFCKLSFRDSSSLVGVFTIIFHFLCSDSLQISMDIKVLQSRLKGAEFSLD